jgi:hypothetical protein
LPREATEKDRFRLLDDGKPIAAQFRLLKDDKKAVALDFAVSLGPLATRKLKVEYGEKVEAGPEPKSGIKLEEGKEAFTVTSGGMKYVVRRDLKGLLDSVRDSEKVFVREKSGGLRIGKNVRLGEGKVKASVVRSGPLAVALRFESEDADKEEGKFASVVLMTFPRSKSWVEVEWTVKGDASMMAADLNLVATASPTVADFGAGSAVYTTLKKGQSARLLGLPGGGHGFNQGPPASWKVQTGEKERWSDLAVSKKSEKGQHAEGWAHLMDRHRCTAIAVADFGRGYGDEIRLDADGRLRIVRGANRWSDRLIHFWLHFVDAPVQVGALTSPQSMMAPLQVEVR